MVNNSDRMKVSISICIVLLLLLSAAAILSPSLSSLHAINSLDSKNLSNNAGHSSDPMAAIELNNIYVVWHDSTPGNADVFLRKSTDNGTSFGDVINLSNNPGNSLFPHIVADGSNVYVVWQDNSNGNNEVFLRKSTDNGTSFGDVINLSNNTGDSLKPQVAMSENGDTYVAWTDKSIPSDTVADIFLRKSTDNGTSFGDVINLSNNPGNSLFTHIVADGSNVYIIWTDYTGGTGFNADIFFRKSTDNGTSFGDVINLSKTGFLGFERPGHSSSPQIVQAMSNVSVVWQDNSNGNNDIYYTNSTDNGISFFDNLSNRFPINLSNNTGDSMFPQISVSGSSIHVVWQDNSNGNNDIYYTNSTDNGISFGNAVNLSNNTGDSLNPRVVVANGSNAYVVWHDSTPGNADVFLRKSTDNGRSFGDVINLSNNPGNSLFPYIVANGSNVYVVWKDLSSGNGDINFKSIVP